MPIAMTSNGQKYYLHYDQIGTLKAVSNAHQKIIKKITYDTYGNIRNETNKAFKVPFGFAGGLYDHDTKLTRFGYRDYDAYTGKWTAKDPIDFDGGDSNLYGYVLQDPVNFTDASGLFVDTLDNPVMIPFYIAVGIYVAADYTADALISLGGVVSDWWNDDVACYSKGDKMLSPGEVKKLKKGGVHPHDLKENARQDLYKDKDGNIVVKRKGGTGPGEPTGLNINDF